MFHAIIFIVITGEVIPAPRFLEDPISIVKTFFETSRHAPATKSEESISSLGSKVDIGKIDKRYGWNLGTDSTDKIKEDFINDVIRLSDWAANNVESLDLNSSGNARTANKIIFPTIGNVRTVVVKAAAFTTTEDTTTATDAFSSIHEPPEGYEGSALFIDEE